MRRRRRIGSSSFCLCLLALLTGGKGLADKKQLQYAVIAGTVFRESGTALAGAEVTLATAPGAKKKLKMKAVSDSRGEFAFHVPAAASNYILRAAAPGFESQEKKAAINADERVDVFFRLAAK